MQVEVYWTLMTNLFVSIRMRNEFPVCLLHHISKTYTSAFWCFFSYFPVGVWLVHLLRIVWIVYGWFLLSVSVWLVPGCISTSAIRQPRPHWLWHRPPRLQPPHKSLLRYHIYCLYHVSRHLGWMWVGGSRRQNIFEIYSRNPGNNLCSGNSQNTFV